MLTEKISFHKLILSLLLFVSLAYVAYTIKFAASSPPSSCCKEEEEEDPFPSETTAGQFVSVDTSEVSTAAEGESPGLGVTEPERTGIQHVVFGIGASAKLWELRRNYIKLWFMPEESMRGIVWLDTAVPTSSGDEDFLSIKISSHTSQFKCTNKNGHRSALRISRIVSETLRLSLPDVRWFVMGDDDTVFVTENLVRILNGYYHREYYYVGSLSESHVQNIYFSYGMAYGGGGFAISYPFAVALEGMQDRCMSRYPGLYGSDDRMHACMAELGVPLPMELGFHQVSV